jgi:hypothetical protein
MRSTVIGLAAGAAIIIAGLTLSASACPYHGGYGGYGGYGRGEYRPEFGGGYRRESERREYPRGKFSHREYRREFERHGHPRREFGGEYRRGEYGERGRYGEYRD